MGIDYTVHGNGAEHVLVMHDWGGDHTTYDPVLPYLDDKAFTYAFVDLRGYGKSKNLTGEYTVTEIANDCLEVADELGWSQFHVMGHSMTGMATQRIALNAPSRVRSAIAVCAVSAAGFPMDEETWEFFSSTTENDDAFLELMKSLSGDLSDQWVETKLRRNRETSTPESRMGYLNMFSKTNFADEVQGQQTPYLVVVGENDSEGLSAAAMKTTFLAMHPNAGLVVIPNCGHYPMQECPPYFATVVENFLRQRAVK